MDPPAAAAEAAAPKLVEIWSPLSSEETLPWRSAMARRHPAEEFFGLSHQWRQISTAKKSQGGAGAEPVPNRDGKGAEAASGAPRSPSEGVARENVG